MRPLTSHGRRQPSTPPGALGLAGLQPPPAAQQRVCSGVVSRPIPGSARPLGSLPGGSCGAEEPKPHAWGHMDGGSRMAGRAGRAPSSAEPGWGAVEGFRQGSSGGASPAAGLGASLPQQGQESRGQGSSTHGSSMHGSASTLPAPSTGLPPLRRHAGGMPCSVQQTTAWACGSNASPQPACRMHVQPSPTGRAQRAGAGARQCLQW